MLLAVVSVGFSASAQSEPAKFTVSTVKAAHGGDRVSVTVTSEDAGYLAGQFTLKFDTDVLTPVAVTAGEAAGDYFIGNKDYASDEVFFATIDDSLISSDGVVATIDFDVKEVFLVSTADLSLTVGTLVGDVPQGYGYNDLDYTTENGRVYASRDLQVPDYNDSSLMEILPLTVKNGFFASGTTWKNLTVDALAANFSESFENTYLDKAGNELSGQSLMTTGSRILLRSGSKEDVLTLSVHGDVDGNYTSDGADAFYAYLVSQGLLNENNSDESVLLAADADNNGVVDENDISLLEARGLE